MQEYHSRIPMLTTCSKCQHTKLTYSKGVIRNSHGAFFRDYPVVRCPSCHTAYFTDLPAICWARCSDVNTRVIAFTPDPDQIEYSLKLTYDYKLVAGKKIYSVYLAPTVPGNLQGPHIDGVPAREG